MTALFPGLTAIGATAGMFPRDPFARVETHGRRCYRCCDCLDVVFTVESAKGAACVCGGYVEFLGRVEGMRLTELRAECPCDERCTSARGPNCDCGCGGKNHGKGLVVRVVRSALPTIEGQHGPETLRHRGATFRANVAALRRMGKDGAARKAEESRTLSAREKIYAKYLDAV